MSGWLLKWRPDCPGSPRALVDGSQIHPRILAPLTEKALHETRVQVGGSRRALREICETYPLPVEVGPPRLVVEGSARFVRLGWEMDEGILEIQGHGGDLLGAGMKGGTILARGDVGNLAGAGMKDGLLIVEGSAGSRLGGPIPGGDKGLSGGEILVLGDAGPQAGLRQRGGLLAIVGRAGELAAYGMRGGTIAVFTGDLALPALEMLGGTLLALGSKAALATGFSRIGAVRHLWLRLLATRLAELQFPVPEEARPALDALAPLESYCGDHLHGGRGEVLFSSGQNRRSP